MRRMRFYYLIIFVVTLLFQVVACKDKNHPKAKYKPLIDNALRKDTFSQYTLRDDTVLARNYKISKLEKKMLDSGLVDILKVDSSIQVDVKYTTTDNFVGMDLYGDLESVYFQPEIANRLKRVQAYLKEKDSALSLLIYDGTRPRSVQWKMWRALDTIPVNERVKFVSNPRNGSIHNYGCAVDLTLMNVETGDTLDMGAGFDDPRKIAYPKYEKEFLESGALTKEQYNNRQLLREVMRKGGFWVLPTEWWHFNGYSRKMAKEKFSPIE